MNETNCYRCGKRPAAVRVAVYNGETLLCEHCASMGGKPLTKEARDRIMDAPFCGTDEITASIMERAQSRKSGRKKS